MALGGENTRDSRYGSTTGIDLLAPIQQNLNPNDIKSVNGKPSYSVWEKWRYFWGFANQNIDKNDSSINTEEGKKRITEGLITKFNSDKTISPWARFGNSNPNRGTNNPLTRDDINAIQQYTQKADTRVIIDGWVGTQTLQMVYPTINVLSILEKGTNVDPNKYYPVIWGNQRYVINTKDYYLPFPWPNSLASYLKIYDPAKYDKNFEGFGYLNKNWIALGKPFTTSETAQQVDNITKKTQSIKNNFQTQTQLNNLF